jgi:hypothetical protein
MGVKIRAPECFLVSRRNQAVAGGGWNTVGRPIHGEAEQRHGGAERGSGAEVQRGMRRSRARRWLRDREEAQRGRGQFKGGGGDLGMCAPGRKPAGITGRRRGLAERVVGETDLASGPGWSVRGGRRAARAERRAGEAGRARELGRSRRELGRMRGSEPGRCAGRGPRARELLRSGPEAGEREVGRGLGCWVGFLVLVSLFLFYFLFQTKLNLFEFKPHSIK